MSEELKLVMIEPRHLGEVDHLHDVQEKAIGTAVDRPQCLKEPVLLAMGFENAEGKLVGGFILEAVAELTFFGVDPDSTKAAVDVAPAIYEFLQSRGIRWLRCLVPKKKRLEKKLVKQFEASGMNCNDKHFSLFSRDLRPAEERDGTK